MEKYDELLQIGAEGTRVEQLRENMNYAEDDLVMPRFDAHKRKQCGK